ncbi:glycoside hydrolase family protein [Flammeovirga sp. SJP92]|uniref:glycoside hydrolase family protein n=1 Tax=Flammeovirga sp. SJP92 TaxID=1775430 RepID=UPI0007883A09|nr:glycoside hydrolase family protein [Flammeovirga sp. SJP92]KXX67933.1 sucrase [Flammeovirga sp. SJP92]
MQKLSKLILKLILASLFFIIFLQLKQKKDPANYHLKLGEAVPHSKFEDKTWSHWGGSIVKDKEGMYHLFYSRWKKELGWAWVTHSEIAHAVADSPYGPFEFKDVTLGVRGENYWDGLCTHNPTVHEFDGKYYLYYMGNTGDGKVMGTPEKIVLNPVHRNNQRIGVAVADHPNGPWKRLDTPLIDISPEKEALDALMVSNPSITQNDKGQFLMVYKAVGKKRKGIWGGPVVHCVATSDSPTGPFKKHPDPIFQAKGYDFPAEDPFIWFQDGHYYAIVKDMHGAFTEHGRSLVLFHSYDGLDWQLSKNPLVSKLEIKWKNGSTQSVSHLERPQLYLEDGKPVVLACAADIEDENGVLHSFNVQLPIVSFDDL